MMTIGNAAGRASSIPAGLGYGAAVSMVMTLVVSGVLAKLTQSEILAWENVGYGIMVILMGASVAGAKTAYGKIKRQKLVVCMLSGVVYLGILLSITALFFGGQYEGVGVTMLLVFGGCLLAALTGNPQKQPEMRRGKKRYHR